MDKKIAELIKKGYTKPQAFMIVKQQGGTTNGYNNNQKPIKRVLRNVETNEVKEGSLPPGFYTKVVYYDDSIDYIKPENEDMLYRMPNYIEYSRNKAKKSDFIVDENPLVKAQQGYGYAFTPKNPWEEGYVAPPKYVNDVNRGTTVPNTSTSQPFTIPSIKPNGWEIIKNYNTATGEPQDSAWNLPSAGNTPMLPKAPTNQETTQVRNEQRVAPINAGMEYKGVSMPTLEDNATKSLEGFQDYANYSTEPATNNNQYTPNRVNLISPDGGLSLDFALNYAGRGFGAKNPWQAGMGTGLSLLKGARNFLTGYGEGKENLRVAEEMQDYQFERPRNYVYGQLGGKIKNSDVLAQNAIVDEGQGNINMEDGEVVLRNNGMVQPVIGEPHIKNGKVAEGVNATLNDGDKVISDYVKLKPADIKDLKERYDVSLKRGATFAQAQKKIDQKLGIKKLEDEKATILEKLEKAKNIKDKNSQELSTNALLKSYGTINEKLNTLQGIRSEAADFIFERQERQPKKGDGQTLFDKNGKEIAQEGKEAYQQGGDFYISQLAKKHNIPLERAMELVKMQMGGEQEQGGQQEQVMQMVAEALQSGVTPEEILEQLVEMGVPQEEGAQLIQGVMQQMQAPQEQQMAQQGGYSFSTRYKPQMSGYQVDGSSVLNQDSLTDVEEIQPYTGKGYGAKMANVDETIKVHDWYFDTEEKKEAFRKAVLKEGRQPEVEAFQKAYNQELSNRAKKAGVPEKELEGIINQVGFSDKGVQKFDGLFGAFTSTRPLFNFKKIDDEVKVEVKDQPITSFNIEEQNPIQVKDRVKNIMSNFEPYIPLFGAIQPIAKQTVDFDRLEPIKATVEPMLAEQERMRATETERIEQLGLSPQQQEALMAQGLATSQISANDAISKVEQWNAQNQFATDQYNAGVSAKEQIMNNQYSADYQNQMMQTLANLEDTTRGVYREQYLQGVQNRKDIANLNLINARSNQFAITNSGIEYLNNTDMPVQDNKVLNDQLEKMTPEEREAYKKYMNFVEAKKRNS
jgi:hypothetical protein